MSLGWATLSDAIGLLNGGEVLPVPGRSAARENMLSLLSQPGGWSLDLAEVRGQGAARRALEVAAAGGHNILLVGPPGAGKTMLARRLPTILPPMTMEEAIEVTRVHSAAGRGGAAGLVLRRPFRSPHHTASDAALAGGGGGSAGVRPGEASLAHHGGAVSRRAARVSPARARGVASAARGRQPHRVARHAHDTISGGLHAGGGDEPLSVRFSWATARASAPARRR